MSFDRRCLWGKGKDQSIQWIRPRHRPWTITQMKEPLSWDFFLVPKYFWSQKSHVWGCETVMFTAGLKPYLVKDHWGTQQTSVVAISGPISSYNVLKINTLWEMKQDFYLLEFMKQIACVHVRVHALFPIERCLNDCLQSGTAMGNSFGSWLKIQLACCAKTIMIALVLPYWQRLQG